MLTEKGNKLHPVAFRDHHNFSAKDMAYIARIFDNIASDRKAILTTEKDAMRLRSLNDERLKNLPVYYIEIEVELLDGAQQFEKEIVDYVRANQIDSQPLG